MNHCVCVCVGVGVGVGVRVFGVCEGLSVHLINY